MPLPSELQERLSHRLATYYRLQLLKQMRLQMPSLVQIDSKMFISNYASICDSAPGQFQVLFTDVSYSEESLHTHLALEQVHHCPPHSLSKDLPLIINRFDLAFKEKKTVLLNCLTGKVFSPFLVVCYLVYYFDYTQEDALRILEDRLGSLSIPPDMLALLSSLSLPSSPQPSIQNIAPSLDDMNSQVSMSLDLCKSIFSSQSRQSQVMQRSHVVTRKSHFSKDKQMYSGTNISKGQQEVLEEVKSKTNVMATFAHSQALSDDSDQLSPSVKMTSLIEQKEVIQPTNTQNHNEESQEEKQYNKIINKEENEQQVEETIEETIEEKKEQAKKNTQNKKKKQRRKKR